MIKINFILRPDQAHQLNCNPQLKFITLINYYQKTYEAFKQVIAGANSPWSFHGYRFLFLFPGPRTRIWKSGDYKRYNPPGSWEKYSIKMDKCKHGGRHLDKTKGDTHLLR